MQKLPSRNYLVDLEATGIFSDPQGNREEVEMQVCNFKRTINLAERAPIGSNPSFPTMGPWPRLYTLWALISPIKIMQMTITTLHECSRTK